MKCRACGNEHAPTIRCEVAARLLATVRAKTAVANSPQATDQVANRHGKYADADKRRAYMRELMRKRRAA